MTLPRSPNPSCWRGRVPTRNPDHARAAFAAQGVPHWRYSDPAHGGSPLLREADSTAKDLRRSGGNRNRKCPPVPGTASTYPRAGAIGRRNEGPWGSRPGGQLYSGTGNSVNHYRFPRSPAFWNQRGNHLRVRRAHTVVSPSGQLSDGGRVGRGLSGGPEPTRSWN